MLSWGSPVPTDLGGDESRRYALDNRGRHTMHLAGESISWGEVSIKTPGTFPLYSDVLLVILQKKKKKMVTV